ncbi:MAG: hypothetical protein ACTS3F_03910 [Phycisphaerales bacterium]
MNPHDHRELPEERGGGGLPGAGGGDTGGGAEVRGSAMGVGAIAVSRVLLICEDSGLLRRVEEGVAGLGVICERAGSMDRGRSMALNGDYDILLLGPECGERGWDLIVELDESRRPIRTIQCCPAGDSESGVRAMRAGAVDAIGADASPEQIRERLPLALQRARALRDDLRRVERLQRMCRRLNQARQDAAERVDELSEDLNHAYRELADQMTAATIANEFASLIRRELDVESLLRVSLEFILGKTGPTNAAVFLPTGRGDFALGAYVNCDIPKDAAEVLLDHLADCFPQSFEHEAEPVRITSHIELSQRIGEDASWLSGHEVLAMAGHHKGECVAVIALFREDDRPFGEELVTKLRMLRDVFASQLGRIISIHNRHKPKSDWNGFDVDRGEGGEGPDDHADDNPWGMAA